MSCRCEKFPFVWPLWERRRPVGNDVKDAKDADGTSALPQVVYFQCRTTAVLIRIARSTNLSNQLHPPRLAQFAFFPTSDSLRQPSQKYFSMCASEQRGMFNKVITA
jgi:hypothetical protein